MMIYRLLLNAGDIEEEQVRVFFHTEGCWYINPDYYQEDRDTPGKESMQDCFIYIIKQIKRNAHERL